MQGAIHSIRTTVLSFLEQVRKGSENLYLILLGAYVAMYFALRINWVPSVYDTAMYVRTLLLSVIMFGSAIYLFMVIVEWKKLLNNTVAMIITAAVILGVTIWFSTTMTLEAYNTVMDIYFCIMVCGKRFKKVAGTIMWVAIGALALAAVGMLVGFTMDLVKPNNVSPGHSLGIIYPNTWGSIAFLIAVIMWYLYMKRKTAVTFVFFWALTAFMYFYISCRTIALLTAAFPFLAMLTDWMEKRQESAPLKRPGILGIVVIATPFLCLALTLLLCWRMEWVHRMFYHTPLETMAMRFVQGGISFQFFGFPLIGHEFVHEGVISAMLNGELVYFSVMDSAYASYAIIRGAIWMFAILSWISFANWKSIRLRDYGLTMISVLICLFGLMERPGLDVWFNFVLLYPLADAIS